MWLPFLSLCLSVLVPILCFVRQNFLTREESRVPEVLSIIDFGPEDDDLANCNAHQQITLQLPRNQDIYTQKHTLLSQAFTITLYVIKSLQKKVNILS